jgi:formyl-CoA transferase
MSRVFSGPWATQILADLGAQVIKVEQPGRGDDLRRLGPPFLIDGEGQPTKESSYYLSVNRNKQSIAIDITSPAGQDVIRRLAQKSDVFIENFKVDNLAKYGLDEAAIRALNPRIVYCSITAFGQTGPNRHRMGYDSLIQAMTGLMSVTGHAEGQPGEGPLKVGLVVSDMMAGMYAAMAIQSALYARDTRGADAPGQAIDISMFDAQLAAMSHQAMHYLVSGQVPQRFGNGAPSVSPSNVFRCRDGHIIMVAGNDAQFRKLCGVLGEPTLASDPRYLTNALRVTNRDALMATPAGAPAEQPDSDTARKIVADALARGERWLDAIDIAQVLQAYHIPTPPVRLARTPQEAAQLAQPNPNYDPSKEPARKGGGKGGKKGGKKP